MTLPLHIPAETTQEPGIISRFMKPYREDGEARKNLRVRLTRTVAKWERLRTCCWPQGGQEIGDFLTGWST